MQETEKQKRKFSFANLFKRFGVIGFLFFLIKGIVVWIIIPALAVYFAW